MAARSYFQCAIRRLFPSPIHSLTGLVIDWGPVRPTCLLTCRLGRSEPRRGRGLAPGFRDRDFSSSATTCQPMCIQAAHWSHRRARARSACVELDSRERVWSRSSLASSSRTVGLRVLSRRLLIASLPSSTLRVLWHALRAPPRVSGRCPRCLLEHGADLPLTFGFPPRVADRLRCVRQSKGEREVRASLFRASAWRPSAPTDHPRRGRKGVRGVHDALNEHRAWSSPFQRPQPPPPPSALTPDYRSGAEQRRVSYGSGCGGVGGA